MWANVRHTCGLRRGGAVRTPLFFRRGFDKVMWSHDTVSSSYVVTRDCDIKLWGRARLDIQVTRSRDVVTPKLRGHVTSTSSYTIARRRASLDIMRSLKVIAPSPPHRCQWPDTHSPAKQLTLWQSTAQHVVHSHPFQDVAGSQGDVGAQLQLLVQDVVVHLRRVSAVERRLQERLEPSGNLSYGVQTVEFLGESLSHQIRSRTFSGNAGFMDHRRNKPGKLVVQRVMFRG